MEDDQLSQRVVHVGDLEPGVLALLEVHPVGAPLLLVLATVAGADFGAVRRWAHGMLQRLEGQADGGPGWRVAPDGSMWATLRLRTLRAVADARLPEQMGQQDS